LASSRVGVDLLEPVADNHISMSGRAASANR